jgi:hypothetical protein
VFIGWPPTVELDGVVDGSPGLPMLSPGVVDSELPDDKPVAGEGGVDGGTLLPSGTGFGASIGAGTGDVTVDGVGICASLPGAGGLVAAFVAGVVVVPTVLVAAGGAGVVVVPAVLGAFVAGGGVVVAFVVGGAMVGLRCVGISGRGLLLLVPARVVPMGRTRSPSGIPCTSVGPGAERGSASPLSDRAASTSS